MTAARAEPQTTAGSARAEAAERWSRLDRRQVVEMALPGALIGLLAGVIAGGLTAMGGQPLDVAVVSALALGAPMAMVGAAYDVLLARGRIPLGPLAPAAVIWFAGFPLGRVFHAAVTDLYAGAPVEVPHGWAAFVVYQVLVSVAFAIGFWWLHENFAPRWWIHIRDRNPVASHFIRIQLDYVIAAQEDKIRRRRRRRREPPGREHAEERRRRPRDRARLSRRAD